MALLKIDRFLLSENPDQTLVGCYLDKPDRAMVGYVMRSNNMNIPICVKTCRGRVSCNTALNSPHTEDTLTLSHTHATSLTHMHLFSHTCTFSYTHAVSPPHMHLSHTHASLSHTCTLSHTLIHPDTLQIYDHQEMYEGRGRYAHIQADTDTLTDTDKQTGTHTDAYNLTLTHTYILLRAEV